MNIKKSDPIPLLEEFPCPETPSPRLLLLFAHPDDETFTAGGTLALHAQKGWDVTLVCATDGERGQQGRRGLDDTAYGELRIAELQRAARILGIGQIIRLSWGDGTVANRNGDQAVADLLEIIEHTKPHAILTFGPDGISGHRDHVAMSDFATAAWRKALISAKQPPPRLFYVACGLAIPSCCLQENRERTIVQANLRVAIETVWPEKLQAMQAYRSQAHLLDLLREHPEGWQMREEYFFEVT